MLSGPFKKKNLCLPFLRPDEVISCSDLYAWGGRGGRESKGIRTDACLHGGWGLRFYTR